MENRNLNRRESFILNWSPLLLVLSLLWLILSLWRGPVFIRYLIACSALGLLYGGFAILNFGRQGSMLPALGVVILIFGEKLANKAFIGGISDRALGWSVLSQYLSIVLLSVFGVAWLFRKKILKQHSQ